MNIHKIYLKLIRWLYRKSNPIFRFDYKTQKELLDKFSPKSRIDMSYYQFKLQQKLKPFWQKIVEFIISFISFHILIKKTKQISYIQSKKNLSICASNESMKRVLPKSLLDKNLLFYDKGDTQKQLISELYDYFLVIKSKYQKDYVFIYKVLKDIITYSNIIIKYDPSEIITFSEYSFSSSILTTVCEMFDIIHTNVMHGEKLFFIRDSYFSYNKFYIWDSYYIKLFTELGAQVDEYIIELPESYTTHLENTNEFDYTYYLGAERNRTLKKIVHILNDLSKRGYRVRIRPHPIYSNLKLIRKTSNDIFLDDNVNIFDSLSSTKCVVSLYSTVLQQAYYYNKTVVVDDLSDFNSYMKLKSLKYIMLEGNKGIIPLSTV